MQFKAFKPEGLNKIAGAMGYKGDMSKFQDFIEQDPARMARMNMFTQAAQQMARGGVVKMQTGGSLSGVSGQEFKNFGAGLLPFPQNAAGDNISPGGGSGGIQAGIPGVSSSGFPAGPRSNVLDGDFIGNDTDPSRSGIFSNVPPKEGEEGESDAGSDIVKFSEQRVTQPALPVGGVTQAAGIAVDPRQFVPEGTGALKGPAPLVDPALAATAQADPVREMQANTFQAQQAAPAIEAALQATEAAQRDPDDPRAQVTAAQQIASSVGNLEAAQGKAILMENPVQREIQQGELISGAADAQTAAQFTEQIQAAEATPSQQATVQGQLAQLTQNFDATNPPSWAAGALRNANAQMAARGLGASSLAGQAIVQATLEAALPIAQADAATLAKFESQNLSNRQQRAMLSAEQRAKFIGQEFDQAFQARVQNASRIADIANQNFTADQQIALENSKFANSINMTNLSNEQALILAEASALSGLDLSNLDKRQQAAVQNAQAFLQRDAQNLTNQQQTELFKGEKRTQSIFSDQSATNMERQINAQSQNQMDTLFANLFSQTSQFNASQANAVAQYNAGQINATERYNSELLNQREQFDAQNYLEIAQRAAQWRREIATLETAALNRANELNANAILDISKQAYDNLWNYYADTMEFAWTAADNAADRQNKLAAAKISADSSMDIQKLAGKQEASSAMGGFAMDIFKGVFKF